MAAKRKLFCIFGSSLILSHLFVQSGMAYLSADPTSINPEAGVQVADRKDRKPSEKVDVNQLNETTAVKEPFMGAKEPRFSAMFDLLLARQPGRANLSFLNFHPLLFAEFVPTPEFNFSFEVNPQPRFFELVYQASPWWYLKAGKIRIPFDDYEYHNTFGGFVNTSRMQLGNVAFLPDIWADLGVGTKIKLADSNDLQLEAHGYVVNGFGSGGTDPTGKSQDYPSFGPDLPINISDNNDDKAVGGRLHGVLYRTFGMGVSTYSGRWTDEGRPPGRIFMWGVDGQVYLGRTTIRGGIITMNVSMPDGGNLRRQGEYGEASYRFGSHDQFKILGRAGYVDPDDRLTDVNDLFTVGGAFIYRQRVTEWSLIHNQDLKKVSSKLGYSFTGVRVVFFL